ncbi:MAG: 2-C-methyl-D-erythritol 2,4-cyclodiphosphate synthase [Tissierellales bacterium]|nr:2-C-methyl-D-erythritol 2,4-cyclodiphosphate synthase [Tissierellales bacterium]
MRIGFGMDVHQFNEHRELILGGVKIQHEKGLLGHSDADVLVHSIMDAILGALALGDIGKHFPDTDMAYKDISSMILLKKVYELMKNSGYKVGNIDAVIAAQNPKLAPYINKMRENVANALNTNIENISIKATTTEKLGFEGREEGMTSYCVCLLEKDVDNKNIFV